MWASVAQRVMRSPLPVLVVVGGLLAVLAAPAFGATFGEVDDRALPKGTPVAVASQIMRDQFPGREATPVQVVVPPGVSAAALASYAANLSDVDGILRVNTPTSLVTRGAVTGSNPQPQAFTASTGRQRLTLVADVDPRTPAGQLVEESSASTSARPRARW